MTDLLVPETCPVLGIPISPEFTCRSDNTPSVDRVDPSRGYVKGNCIVISWRANRLKSDATLNELQRMAQFYTALETQHDAEIGNP